jgi:hypothetical protein
MPFKVYIYPPAVYSSFDLPSSWYLSVDYGNFERARLDEILALLVDVPPTPCGVANLIERE